MHKVDLYLLKNACFIFALANILAYLPRELNLFPWLNAAALGLCLLLLFLIRLTIRRYAEEFGWSRAEVKDLLGRYIEDDRRGKVSFYDYLQRRRQAADHPGAGADATN